MKALIVMTALFISFVTARYYVFDAGAPRPTARMYDKPVTLRALAIPSSQIPQGYSLTNGTAQGNVPPPVKAGDIHSSIPRIDRADFPEPTAIGEYLIAIYTSTMGEKVTLVTAQYKAKGALAKLDLTKYKDPRYVVIDHQLTWIDADVDEAAARFSRAFRDNATEQKRKRSGVEKLVVASNAYLKFFADLLVGAFGFVLALFFTKYFLIVRQTE
jgi:hypothetical protein